MGLIETSAIDLEQSVALYEQIVFSSRTISHSVNARKKEGEERLSGFYGKEIRAVHDKIELIVTMITNEMLLLSHIGFLNAMINETSQVFVPSFKPIDIRQPLQEIFEDNLQMWRLRKPEVENLRRRIGLSNKQQDLSDETKFPKGWAIIVRGKGSLTGQPFNGRGQFLEADGNEETYIQKDNQQTYQEPARIEILLANIHISKDSTNLGSAYVTVIPLVSIEEDRVELIQQQKQNPQRCWIWNAYDVITSIRPSRFHPYLIYPKAITTQK